MRRQRLTIRAKDSSATLSGVDIGPEPRVVVWDGDQILVKVLGHSAWSGLGQQSYVPARIWHFRVISTDVTPTGYSLHVEKVLDYPARTQTLDLRDRHEPTSPGGKIRYCSKCGYEGRLSQARAHLEDNPDHRIWLEEKPTTPKETP